MRHIIPILLLATPQNFDIDQLHDDLSQHVHLCACTFRVLYPCRCLRLQCTACMRIVKPAMHRHLPHTTQHHIYMTTHVHMIMQAIPKAINAMHLYAGDTKLMAGGARFRSRHTAAGAALIRQRSQSMSAPMHRRRVPSPPLLPTRRR